MKARGDLFYHVGPEMLTDLMTKRMGISTVSVSRRVIGDNPVYMPERVVFADAGVPSGRACSLYVVGVVEREAWYDLALDKEKPADVRFDRLPKPAGGRGDGFAQAAQ